MFWRRTPSLERLPTLWLRSGSIQKIRRNEPDRNECEKRTTKQLRTALMERHSADRLSIATCCVVGSASALPCRFPGLRGRRGGPGPAGVEKRGRLGDAALRSCMGGRGRYLARTLRSFASSLVEGSAGGSSVHGLAMRRRLAATLVACHGRQRHGRVVGSRGGLRRSPLRGEPWRAWLQRQCLQAAWRQPHPRMPGSPAWQNVTDLTGDRSLAKSTHVGTCRGAGLCAARTVGQTGRRE